MKMQNNSSQYLDVVVRIPVRVINKHRVCSGEIDSQAASTGGQQKTKGGRIGGCNGIMP